MRQVRACLEREEKKMNDQLEQSSPAQEGEDFGHPRGTLAIVLIYGILFVLIWGGLYVFQFLGRGVPQP